MQKLVEQLGEITARYLESVVEMPIRMTYICNQKRIKFMSREKSLAGVEILNVNSIKLEIVN